MTDQELLPKNIKNLLLHVCCAPCSCSIIERLLLKKVDFSIIFYNPNIAPQTEYEQRKKEVIQFINKKKISSIDADYDYPQWLAAVKGLELEPERGLRCTLCFDIRLGYAAKYAYNHGYNFLASSLSISRWKDLDQVNNCGKRAVSIYPNLKFLDVNWRKNGGTKRMHEIVREQNFYKQTYCGCQYSYQPLKELSGLAVK